jgi:hypothetical protein
MFLTRRMLGKLMMTVVALNVLPLEALAVKHAESVRKLAVAL